MKEVSEWNIICTNDAYCAPECVAYYLIGKLDNGRYIRTSYIVRINMDNKIINTISGSEYKVIGETIIPEDMPDTRRCASLKEVYNQCVLNESYAKKSD